MPFFPPILASIIATNVVGIAMKGMPRQCVAATNPTISRITPPPTPMSVACLGIERRVSCLCKDKKVSSVFACSPSGMVRISTENPNERAVCNKGESKSLFRVKLVMKTRGKSFDNVANSKGLPSESTKCMGCGMFVISSIII